MPHPGPRPRQLAQRFAIDLRVDRGGRDLLVTEDVADLGQRGARAQHVGGGGVPQPVRRHLPQAGPLAGANHHLRHRARVERLAWRDRPHEDAPPDRVAGAGGE
jgi:hypothetical protein